LEGATSEKTEAATMSTISEPKNEPVVQLYAPKQKAFSLCCLYSLSIFCNAGVELYYQLKHPFPMQDIKISVEEGTSSTHSKSVSSSSGLSTTSKSETSSPVSDEI
jgi:hypothetical protein